MARSGMADNIYRVRTLAGAGTAEYTVGTASLWDDDQIANVLDRHRTDMVRQPLIREVTYTGGGSVVYTRFRSPRGFLETVASGTAAFQIEDALGDARGTATYTADYHTGIFDFTTDQMGTVLYARASSYDVYAAAGEVLDAWATKVAQDFDFTADGQSFARSQKVQALRSAASDMRKRARPRTTNLRTG
jgi:hypothetical protein